MKTTVITLLLCLSVIIMCNPCSGAVTAEYITSLNLGGYADDIAISGNYAYIITQDGLDVVNISTPAQPKLVGFCSLTKPLDICVQGNYAYVVGDNSSESAPTTNGKLTIINISTPSSPSVVGTYVPLGLYKYVTNVCVSGSYAYIQYRTSNSAISTANQTYYVLAINVSLPNYPKLSGTCKTTTTTTKGYGLAVTGSYVYTADASLWKINASSPSSMTLSSITSVTNPRDICLYNSYVCLSEVPTVSTTTSGTTYTSRLRVINTGTSSTGTWTLSSTDYADRICAYNGRVFLACGSDGIRVINISAPSSPKQETSSATPGTASGVAASGDYVYVADGNSGLSVYQLCNPMPNLTLTASPASTQYLGSSVTLTASADSSASLQYKFMNGTTILQDFSTSATYPWTPSATGTYSLSVVGKDSIGRTATSPAVSYTIAPSLKSVSVSASPASPQTVGTPVTFTATAVGGTNLQYKFMAESYVMRDFSTSNTLTWTFSTSTTHSITVIAKDSSGNTVTSPVLPYTVVPQVTSVSVSASPVSPQLANTIITFTAKAIGGAGLQYRFMDGSTVLSDFASSNTLTLIPTTTKTYKISVLAKDSSGKTVTSTVLDYVITPPVQSVSLSASPLSPQLVGAPVTLTANAVGGTGLLYRFKAGISMLRDYSSSNTLIWRFSNATTHQLTVSVKDSTGKIVTSPILEYVILPTVQSASLSASPASPQPVGAPVTLTAGAVGGLGLQYKFKAGISTLRDYSSSNTLTWKFSNATTHQLTVSVKDSSGKIVTSPILYYTITAQ